MNAVRFTLRAVSLLALTLFLTSFVQAQATRTWVSGVGDDVNPCSRTAPCKTFAGAISKTAKDGEINCIDPGGFGTVTIVKSITIDGYGPQSSILNAGGISGINVNITDVNDVRKSVRIANISIHGAATGLHGINFIAGLSLRVENCVIFGQSSDGIHMAPSGAAELFVTNTNISNTANGIGVTGGAGTVQAELTNVTTNNCTSNGVLATGSSARVAVRGLSSSGNVGSGVAAQNGAHLTIDDSILANNGTGISATTAAALIHMSNTTITKNATAVTISSGDIFTFGNNRISDNTSDGSVAAMFSILEK